jgi:hypothetical protein
MAHIGDSPEDFATAFESAFARFQIHVEETCAGQPDWPGKMAAAIRAGFEFAAADPASAELLVIQAPAAGPDGIVRHQRLLGYVAGRFAHGRRMSERGDELPPVTEEAIAGGLLGLVSERLIAGDPERLPELAPGAIEFALTPYLGAAQAARAARA